MLGPTYYAGVPEEALPTPHEWFSRAKNAELAGRSLQAVEGYTNFLRLDEGEGAAVEHHHAHLWLGNWYLSRSEWYDAETYGHNAIRILPNHPGGYRLVAKVHRMCRRFVPAAEKLFDMARNTDCTYWTEEDRRLFADVAIEAELTMQNLNYGDDAASKVRIVHILSRCDPGALILLQQTIRSVASMLPGQIEMRLRAQMSGYQEKTSVQHIYFG